MSPTAALLFYNRAAVESNRGSEQAHKVRAVKGAHERREWELHSCRPDHKIQIGHGADFNFIVGITD